MILSKKINSLEELLVHELKDVYSAEKQLVKVLPTVIDKASAPQLKNALDEHLRQTEVHVERLERVFGMLNQEPEAVKCKGMQGILDEGDETLDLKAPSEILDAGIILAAQKVEHYEIATYGSLATWAEMLGRNEVKMLLGETLEEEEQADKKLTML